jgi:hypothetical protein
VFVALDGALEYAQRWREARIAQLARIHELTVRRGLELGRRMQTLARERGHLMQERASIGTKLKANEDSQRLLVEEANDPEVELDLRPTSDAWRLYDAPSETDGTLDRNHRQLVLEHTGLEPIKPAVQGKGETVPDDEAPPPPTALHAVRDQIAKGTAKLTMVADEPEAAPKLPPKVKGKGDTWCKPGDRVVTFTTSSKPSGEGWLVEIDRQLPARADGQVVYGVVVLGDDLVAHHMLNHQIQRTKKARGAKCPTWPRIDEVAELGEVEGAETPDDPRPWPPAMRDRNGRPISPGDLVDVLGHEGMPGYAGKLTGEWGELDRDNGRAVGVGVETLEGPAAGMVVREWRGHVARSRGDARPGLDPGGVVWPEDEGSPEV